MSRYWAGDDAWTNPPLQALPRRREGSGGGLEYGSGAFDVTSQSWSYLTASDTLDGFFDPSHVQADVPTSVRNVPPTESHTLLHQTPNSAPVSIDQHILNQLGPNELADSGTIWNADQFDFNSISPFPSRPPSSASDYIPGVIRMQASGIITLARLPVESNPSRPASASPFPGDFDWHDDSSEAFQDSTSAFAPPLASDLEQHENDFGTFPESTSNHSALDRDSDLVGTHFPKSSLQPDSEARARMMDTLHPGVSSKVVDFPDGFPVTTKTKMFHIELVNGIPSQFPIPEEATAFIVCANTLAAEDKRKTIDAILKDYVTLIPTEDRPARAASLMLSLPVPYSDLTEAKSNSSGRVPGRRPSKGKKAETNTQGKLNAKQASALRRSSSRVASRSVELEREDIQEDEHEGMQGEKEGEALQMANLRHLRSRRAKSPPPALYTSPSDAAPSNGKRKLTSAAVVPTPKPKRRKAGDPLAGWAIELVPGDKTTAVTPREYAQKEPEEFAAQYPQYVKFL
ncbi:hypothetical protein B0H13DRAFT_2313099 [Mycena leptocephala]|nr:hypothetical protein B0H13DRAFT_2313099 [Mycena leptocephala]